MRHKLYNFYFTIFVVIYLSCPIFCIEWLIYLLQLPLYLIGCTCIWSLIIELLHSYVSSSKRYCLKWNIFFLLLQNGNLSSCTDIKMFFAVFLVVFCNSQCCKRIYFAFFSHGSSPILLACFFCLFLYKIKLSYIMYFSLSESLSSTHRWLSVDSVTDRT